MEIINNLARAKCPHCDKSGGFAVLDPLILHKPCGTVHRASRLQDGTTTGAARANIMRYTNDECFCEGR